MGLGSLVVRGPCKRKRGLAEPAGKSFRIRWPGADSLVGFLGVGGNPSGLLELSFLSVNMTCLSHALPRCGIDAVVPFKPKQKDTEGTA